MEFHLEDNHFFRRCFEGNPKGEEGKYIFKFCKLDINIDKNITSGTIYCYQIAAVNSQAISYTTGVPAMIGSKLILNNVLI